MKEPNSSGVCLCGCGKKTNKPRYGNKTYGWVGGKPIKYVHGHNTLKTTKMYRETANGCWNWLWCLSGGRRGRNGNYGRLTIRKTNKLAQAHRVIYKLCMGPIPKGLVLDHLCRNEKCVNPNHLEPVTLKENTLRGRHIKLSASAAKDVRKLYRKGNVAQSELARKYDVDQSSISLAISKKTWN